MLCIHAHIDYDRKVSVEYSVVSVKSLVRFSSEKPVTLSVSCVFSHCFV